MMWSAVADREATLAAYNVRSEAPRRRVVLAAWALGLGLLFLLLPLMPGVVDGSDAQSMYQVTRSIVERSDVTVYDPSVGVRGLDGNYYSKYGPGQSIAAVPLYLAGRALEAFVPAHYQPELPVMASSLLPLIATALTVVLLVLAAIELGATVRGALLLGLVYGLATPAVVYTTQWFSEPLTACGLLLSVYMLLRDWSEPSAWRPLLAGAGLAIAVATRIESVLFVPFLFLYTYAVTPREGRVARLTSLLLPLGAVLAALSLYNTARFGSPLETGYGHDTSIFAYHDTHPAHTLSSFVQGVYGLLVSPGKGLLEYAPVVLLAPFGAAALWARRRAACLLLLALILVDLCAHANILIRWVGGWSWGPRFLMPVLPLIVLLIAPLLGPGVRWGRLTRAALVLLAIAGIVVQAPAMIVNEPRAYISQVLLPRYEPRPQPVALKHLANMDRMESDYTSKPNLSPIVGSWRILQDPATWRQGQGLDVSPATVAVRNRTVAPRPWWHLLALQGVSKVGLIAACAVALAIGLILLILSLVWSRPRLTYTPIHIDTWA